MPGSEFSLYLTLTTILEIGVAPAAPHMRLDSLPKVTHDKYQVERVELGSNLSNSTSVLFMLAILSWKLPE